MVSDRIVRSERARVVSFLPDHRVVLSFRGDYVVAYARLPLVKGDRVRVKASRVNDRTLLRIVGEDDHV